ncbi:LysR family transcriptional regulator [Actinoplanes sp. NPDC051851]|uniref:LysR family transcriptional regulator n=1 Tax=Actinoplanes sp. NPDC051851 TaxID=3154753 RepID=UPI00342CC10F
MVSLDLLRTFLAVHRAGTLTRAAEVVGLSQPTVTAQVRALEGELGHPLFVRGARGVTPTAFADDLARRLDGPMDALDGVATGLTGMVEPTLHLGGPAELMTARVLPALSEYKRHIRVKLGLADDLLTELSAGRLDLVVSAVRPRKAGIHAEPLCDEEFTLVAAHKITDISEISLLSYAEDLPIIRRWWRHVLGAPPPNRATLVVPDLRALRAAAVAGMGATVLPRYLIEKDLADGTLVELHPTDDPPINTIYLATRKSTRNTPHIAEIHAALIVAGKSW